jgi:hypothetical protein
MVPRNYLERKGLFQDCMSAYVDAFTPNFRHLVGLLGQRIDPFYHAPKCLRTHGPSVHSVNALYRAATNICLLHHKILNVSLLKCSCILNLYIKLE